MVPHTGPLLVLLPGLGAVATTFLAGVEAIRQGRVRPIGAFSQLGRIPLQEDGGE